jgi:homoserine O-acetyltransferase
MRPKLTILALLAPVIAAAQPRQPSDGVVTLRDYRLNGGQTIPELHLHYLTLGRPRLDEHGHVINAAVLLHGTTGSARSLVTADMEAGLYGPGQPLDTSRLFLVIPDGIGAGGSTKPSDGLCGRFPRYGYLDQIQASHELLAHIGVAHAKVILGTSMGGMEAWLWAERYPDFADAFVAVASTPLPVTGRNALWRETIIQAIENDPDWRSGQPDAAHPPHDWTITAAPLFDIMTEDVTRLQAAVPDRAAAPGYVHSVVDKELRTANACDFLYKFDSSFDYDPAPLLGRISAPFLSINFGDDLLNPPEFLHLPARPNFHKFMVTDPANLYGHETAYHPAVWAGGLRTFLDSVPGLRGP